jgi:predicted phage-related endonuclease
MMLEGCSWGVIAALVVGDYVFDLHIAEVERDPEAEERLKDAALQFWSAIDKGEIPALDPQRDADVVKLMYPTTTPKKVIDLSRDNRILELLDKREQAAAEETAAAERKAAAETELREKIQDAEIALVPGWKVTLRTTNRKAHMVKATSYRTLRATRAA